MSSADFFQNCLIRKILSGKLSECQHIDRPDFGPNCFQSLSADDDRSLIVTTRERVNLI